MKLYIVVKLIKYKNGSLVEFKIEHVFDTLHDANEHATELQHTDDANSSKCKPEHDKDVSWVVVKSDGSLHNMQSMLSDIKVTIDKLRKL